MRIKKIYFNRMYDQWRGEPLYVEDGLDDDKLYIRIMDVPDYKEGAINTITADYKDFIFYLQNDYLCDTIFKDINDISTLQIFS